MMKNPTDQDFLTRSFDYHPPREGQPAKYQAITIAAKQMAEVILREAPPGPDRDHALELLRSSRMWANASIACQAPEE